MTRYRKKGESTPKADRDLTKVIFQMLNSVLLAGFRTRGV